MPRFQFLRNLLQRYPSTLQQHQQMKNEVSRLGNDLLIGLDNSSQCHFEPFLANLLRDALGALAIQARRVAAFRPIGDALLDDGLRAPPRNASRSACVTVLVAEAGGSAECGRRARAAAP